MIFAVIGAIRGDAPVFLRVIQAIEEEGIVTIFHTGNLVAGGDSGPQIVATLNKQGIRGVQGMEDRLLTSLERKRSALARRLEPDSLAELERAARQLSCQELELLRGLPKTAQHCIDGVEIGLCCGSPANVRETVGAHTTKDRLLRLREDMPCPILICGSASAYFSAWVGNTLLIAPPPLHRADGQGQFVRVSTEDTLWTAEVVSVPHGS